MYTTYYNLREEPFRLTSDPRFFHLAEPHAAALATLVEAVLRRQRFLLVTGPVGNGKKTVCYTALQNLSGRDAGREPNFFAFILKSNLTPGEILGKSLT